MYGHKLFVRLAALAAVFFSLTAASIYLVDSSGKDYAPEIIMSAAGFLLLSYVALGQGAWLPRLYRWRRILEHRRASACCLLSWICAALITIGPAASLLCTAALDRRSAQAAALVQFTSWFAAMLTGLVLVIYNSARGPLVVHRRRKAD